MKRERKMTTRKRTIFIIVITLGFLSLLWSFSAQYFLLDRFEQIERFYAEKNVERSLNAFWSLSGRIDALVKDWGNWDDTYDFIESGNSRFISSNLPNAVFTANRLNLIAFFNESKELVYGKYYDLKEHKSEDLPGELLSEIIRSEEYNYRGDKGGLLKFRGRIIYFCTAPVLRSDGSGPARGFLIMAREIDDALYRDISEMIRLEVEGFCTEETGNPKDMKISETYEGRGYSVFTGNPDTLLLCITVRDTYSRPVLLLRAKMPRPFNRQGYNTKYYLGLLFLFTAFIYSALMLLLLDRNILSKLARLNRDVIDITKGRNLHRRIHVKGKDEFASLATGINNMLEQIESTERALKESNDELEMRIHSRTVELEIANKALESKISQTTDMGEKLNRNYKRLESIFLLTNAVSKATSLDEIYREAIEAVEKSLESDRVSILLFDETGKMRFKAYRGLSEAYVKAVDGHSPWKKDEKYCRPIAISDILKDESVSALRQVIADEGIRALCFFPIVYDGRLLGKFMAYYDQVHEFSRDELETLSIISEQVAFAIERKCSENELIQAKEKAEKSDHLKSEFLAQISHEIRTPVNTILCFISLVKDSLADRMDEEIRQSFGIIEKGSKRLIRTIDLLLHMSQLQTGMFEIRKRELELSHDIIEPVIVELHSLAKEKNLSLLYHNMTNGEMISGDADMLRQVFTQIIDNAIKYTSRGKIEIVQYRNDKGQLSVAIQDTGIGISEDYLESLFTPFSQEDSGYTRRFEGNGLGLALAKKYCRLNSADINVKSRKGEGTTFIVSFNSEALLKNQCARENKIS